MVDAATDTRTDTVAARGGGTRADVIAAVKAMYCGGTRDTGGQRVLHGASLVVVCREILGQSRGCSVVPQDRYANASTYVCA